MTKYVEWCEPFDSEAQVNLICRVRVDEISKWQRSRDDRYTSDQQALDDFLVVHWGQIKDYED